MRSNCIGMFMMMGACFANHSRPTNQFPTLHRALRSDLLATSRSGTAQRCNSSIAMCPWTAGGRLSQEWPLMVVQVLMWIGGCLK